VKGGRPAANPLTGGPGMLTNRWNLDGQLFQILTAITEKLQNQDVDSCRKEIIELAIRTHRLCPIRFSDNDIDKALHDACLTKGIPEAVAVFRQARETCERIDNVSTDNGPNLTPEEIDISTRYQFLFQTVSLVPSEHKLQT
jgi:hypothetical protein